MRRASRGTRSDRARRPCAPSSARRRARLERRARPERRGRPRRSGRASRRARSPRRSSAGRSRRRVRGDRRASQGEEAAGRRRPSCRRRPAPWPGHRRRSNGQRASVPSGQTVSRCPTSSTRVCWPNRQRKCVRPSAIDPLARSTERSARRDRRRRRRKTRRPPGRHSATRLTTSASRASTISGRRRRSAPTNAGDGSTAGDSVSRPGWIGTGVHSAWFRSARRSELPTSSSWKVVLTDHAAGTTRMEPSIRGDRSTDRNEQALARTRGERERRQRRRPLTMPASTFALLDSVAEFEAASRLIARIWSDDEPKAPTALLRALSHAGNFVAGAFSGDRARRRILRLLRPRQRPTCTCTRTSPGVDPRFQNRSLGFALKQFQRSWALERGTSSIRVDGGSARAPQRSTSTCASSARPSSTTTRTSTVRCSTGSTAPARATASLLHWELASASCSRGRRPSLRSEPVVRPGAVIVAPGTRRLSGRHALAAKRCSSRSPTTSSGSGAAIPVSARCVARSGSRWRSAARSTTDTGPRRSRATAGSS